MSKNILIVEDEENNLIVLIQILQFLLRQWNLHVARDGHEAIRMAYEDQPDIILLDLTLPKLSGWEVARSLRSDGRFRNTPILALTAHAMVGDRERALETGCDDYFAKPIDVDEFVKFMEPYLSDVRSTGEGPNEKTPTGEEHTERGS
jgi:two-component system cell cycle response regulator DivK